MRLSLIFIFVKPIFIEFHIFLLLKINYDCFAMNNSRKILADHKVSITNPRIIVLEALLELKGPITVEDLLAQLKNKVAKSTLQLILPLLLLSDCAPSFCNSKDPTASKP